MKKTAATIQQEVLWLDAIKHSFAYWNILHSKTVSGRIAVDTLRKSLYGLTMNETALRTNFVFENDALWQIVRDITEPEIVINSINSTEISAAAGEKIVADEMKKLQKKEFDAEKELLFCISVIQFNDAATLILVINHLIADNHSLQLFWKKLSDLYTTASEETLFTETKSRQYTDYAEEISTSITNGTLNKQKIYWQNKLSENTHNSLSLPFAGSGQAATSISHKEILLPASLTEDIRTLTLRHKLLFSSVFLTPYFLLLYKYSGNKKLQVENMISGRGGGAGKNNTVLGLFARTVPVTADINSSSKLSEILQAVSSELIAVFANGDYPPELLSKEPVAERNTRTTAAFRPLFNLINEYGSDDDVFGLASQEDTEADFTAGMTPEKMYDIVLYIFCRGKKTYIRLEARTDEKTVGLTDYILDSYLTLLNQVVYNNETTLTGTSMLTGSEISFLYNVNSRKISQNEDRTIIDLFRQQAALQPDSTALKCGAEIISYKNLDAATDSIAGTLIKNNVSPGDTIGIYLSRSAALIKAIIAVLKTGAAYLPLDPAAPDARLAWITENSGVKFIIADSSLSKKAVTATPVLTAENLFTETGNSGEISQHLCNTSSLAYIIYTSGSTGRPKGVMVGHKALYNFICGIKEEINFSRKTLYSMTSAEFDIFALEIFAPLCSGGTVVLATAEETNDPLLAAEKIQQHNTALFQSTPSRLTLLLQAAGNGFLRNIESLLAGGERLPETLFTEIKKSFPGVLYNLYGPTETTIWSSVKNLTGEAFVTAGTPIRNTRIYIVNNDGDRQGIGIWGEILIGGSGVADGYCNNEALTKERFVPDTFFGDMLYKTGDIGRWLPCGNLEIAGRNDEQIKIRGYRVEIREIEHRINTYPGIERSVVICNTENETEELCAYVTAASGFIRGELTAFLKKWLPAYMIPSKIIRVDSFPLNTNGKIDKQQLKAAVSKETETREKTEEKNYTVKHPVVLALWTAALGEAGDDPVFFDNFFDSGGHSLKAVRFLRQLEASTGVKIKPRDFFITPSVHFVEERLKEHQQNIFFTEPAIQSQPA